MTELEQYSIGSNISLLIPNSTLRTLKLFVLELVLSSRTLLCVPTFPLLQHLNFLKQKGLALVNILTCRIISLKNLVDNFVW